MSASPQRIQLSRRKGWRMPANTVKVCRPTKWGNPWKVGQDYVVYSGPDGERSERFSAKECVARYRAWIMRTDLHLGELQGKNLACWCKPGAPCHADFLLEIANT